MSKPPTRNRINRYLSSGNLEILFFRKWNNTVSAADSYASANLHELLRALKRYCIDKLHLAVCADKSTNLDEKIFEHYKKLLNLYGEVIESHNKNFGSYTNRNLAIDSEGILNILKSRYLRYAEKTKDGDVNPISIEKKELVKNTITEYVNMIDKFTGKFEAEKEFEFIIAARKLFFSDKSEYAEMLSLCEHVKADFLADFCPELHTSFENSVKKCFDELNNFEGRVSCKAYYNLLVSEKRIINSIINYQLPQLENDIQRSLLINDERAHAQSLVSSIRDIGSYFNGEAAEFLDELAKSQERYLRHGIIISVDEYEAFSSDLSENVRVFELVSHQGYDVALASFREQHDEFVLAINSELIIPEFNAARVFSINKEIYETKKLIIESSNLALEIASVFKHINEFCNEKSELLKSSKNIDIINGIKETLDIKVESIEEAQASFKDTASEALNASIAELELNGSADYDKMTEVCLEEIYDNMLSLSRDDRRIVGVFRRLINDFPSFENLKSLSSRLEKQNLAHFEKIRKKAFSFKKENILFEISTFEEVLHYSVSRIRENQSEADLAFLEAVDNADNEISRILKYNGIELIRPEPYEIFNGKEHEVLVAEVNDQFKKGEVIKLMNSGYKQNDVVIIRANVIACK